MQRFERSKKKVHDNDDAAVADANEDDNYNDRHRVIKSQTHSSSVTKYRIHAI